MQIHKVVRWGLVGLFVAASVQAASYTWNVTTGGNWSDNTKWNPSGVPGELDDVLFSQSAVQTVTIGTGDQAAYSVTVTGNGLWTWSGTAALTNGAGNFNYSSSATTTSRFTAVLAGTGGVIVNSGVLNIYNTANTFSGNVVINGGVLQAGPPTSSASSNDLGVPAKTIYLGSTAPGVNDAALHIGAIWAGTPSLYQPMVVRAGNNGGKTIAIGPYYGDQGTYLASDITLQTNLTLLTPFVKGQDNKWTYRYRLHVYGGVSGNGNLTKEGLGTVYLAGTNSYEGTTVVEGGKLFSPYMATPYPHTVKGDFVVRRGELIATAGSLGRPQNVVYVGAPGSLGMFSPCGASWASCYFTNPIVVQGNGAILGNRNDNTIRWLAPMGGTGTVIFANGWSFIMYSNNTFQGDVHIVDSMPYAVDAAARTTFGLATNIYLGPSAILYLQNAVNLSSNALVRMWLAPEPAVWGGTLRLATDQIPEVSCDSAGYLALDGTRGAAVNARLADVSRPYGNGNVYLWGGNAYGLSTFTGTNLGALVANDSTHTYRFGCGLVHATSWLGDLMLDAPNGTAGALRDLGGVPHHVQVGIRPLNTRSAMLGALCTRDEQTFTGNLTIYNGQRFLGILPAGTASPLGSSSGAVYLYGNAPFQMRPYTLTVSNEAGAARSVAKGAVTFSGSVGISVNGGSAAPANTTTLTLASLTRVGRSDLAIMGERGYLNSAERIMVTAGPVATNGMVPPYFWNARDGTFLDYNANGFKSNTWDRTTLAGGTANDKVNIGADEQVPAAGASLYALRTDGALLANGAAVLTNTGGGLIFLAAPTARTNRCPLDFGSREALVICQGGTNYVDGAIKCSGGLVKTGPGVLCLRANNTGLLSGGITINDGDLYFTNTAALGGPGNPITLNGGRLLYMGPAYGVIANDVYLGDNGGSVDMGPNGGNYSTFRGRISGPGPLILSRVSPNGYLAGNGTIYLSGTNTYTGGTLIGGFKAVYVTGTGAKLGPGVVALWDGNENTAAENQTPKLFLEVDGAVDDGHAVVIRHWSGSVYFRSANPRVGSIEGNGHIKLGTDAVSCRLTVGGNNRSTMFYGGVVDYSEKPERQNVLAKVGTGTLTIWGECWQRGGTVVSNGTLALNNWCNTEAPVTVYGGVLEGMGTVGPVTNLGGTVRGNLRMKSLTSAGVATLAVGLRSAGDCDRLTAAQGVTLGGTLELALGYAPTAGQSLTIVDNGGILSGVFANAPSNNAVISAAYGGRTYYFRVNYDGGDGNDVVLTALWRLEVASACGTTDPAVGVHYFAADNVPLSAAVLNSPITAGGAQYACAGWTLAGNAPVSGNGTNFTTTLTNNAVLTWLWRTNYWLDTEVSGAGSVDVGDGWYGQGTAVEITATPDEYYELQSWTGNTNGCTIAGRHITVPMDQPRTITAVFVPDSKVPPRPVPYLESFEEYPAGFLVVGTNGWVSPYADAIAVAASNYAYGGLYPLPAEGHTNVADLLPGWVTNRLAGPTNRTVWVDMMLSFDPTYDRPTEADPGVQLGLRLQTNGFLLVWHRDPEAGTNRWTELQQARVEEGQWVRVSARIDYETVDNVYSCRYFQLLVDGVLVTNAAAYTANDGTGETGGSWFALVATGTPRKLSAVVVGGRTALDDYVVTTNTPLLHTITASAGVHGWIMPSGVVAVAHEASTNITIGAEEHYHVAEVVVDGESVGPTNAWTFIQITRDHSIAAHFALDAHTLQIVSAHGAPVPPVGVYTQFYGTVLTNRVNGADTQGTTQYVCTGWTLAGNAPVSGATTSVVLTLTNNAVLTWVWRTNYWLDTEVSGQGAVSPGDGWYAAGSNVLLTAVPSNGWEFSGWSGDTNGCTVNSNQLTAPMTRPRNIGANFSTGGGMVIYYVNWANPTPQPPYTNWGMAATNIQNAIDVAPAGALVLVSNGVYSTGKAVVNGSTNRIALTKALTVRSVNGPQVTEIVGYKPAGPAAVRGVYMTNGAVLIGFTVRDGATATGGNGLTQCSGGGVWCASTSAVISNCVIRGNVANQSGGGVFRGTVKNSLLLTNSAAACGGGACSSVVYACTFVTNSAANGGGAYGGLMWNSLLYRNAASSRGGGCYGLTNYACTVARNTAKTQGGGMAYARGENSVVYDNTCKAGANHQNCTFIYTCTTPLPGGAGNIVNPPLFVNAAADNYRLQSNSPCINAGTNQDWMAEMTDLDGNPRIINGRVDMGAYEYGGAGARLIGREEGDSENDGNSALCITEIAAVSDRLLVLRWASATGLFYRIDRSTNLLHGFSPWVGGIPAAPPENTYTDRLHDASPAYYRIVIEP